MSEKVSNVEQPVEAPVRPAALNEVDRMTVELAKSARRECLANAKAALAEQEKVDAQYRLLVNNLFSKYGLTVNDKIEENGTIVYGGANVND